MPVSSNPRRRRRAAVPAAIAALALLTAMMLACRGADDAAPVVTATAPATAVASATASASASATAAPPPIATATATAPPPTATVAAPAEAWPPALGVAAVDAAVTAFRAGNLPALVALVRPASAACTTAFGAGGPPKCPAGVADGTVVEYLPYFECDGWGSFDGLRTRLVHDSTYALVVLGYTPPVAAHVTDAAVITHAVVLARAGLGATDASDARLLTTIAFDDESIREISGDCGAYSQAALAAGELPAHDEARVLWRRYPAPGGR